MKFEKNKFTTSLIFANIKKDFFFSLSQNEDDYCRSSNSIRRNLSQKLCDWVGDKCYENLGDSKFNRLI